MRELGIRPIAGLLHHGHGPVDTSLLDPRFPEKFAAYARAVAERYPWIDAYTPVNEPLTTARFCGLYGVWFPHRRDAVTFARILLTQCRATVLAMRAVRAVNPAAQLVQNEDIGKVHSTPRLASQAEYENERRWLTFDLLCGKVDQSHPFWRHFRAWGLSEAELGWFIENRCPPDILGFDYYVTSERFLDHHVERYPAELKGGNGREEYVDIMAAHVRAEGLDGPPVLLRETWDRYRLPIAVTEAHHGSTREEQLRWFLDFWRAAEALRADGADIRAVTAWALLGLFDWNSLVTREAGWYEPGAFDVRGPVPRATAIAELIRGLAAGKEPDHPVLAVPGWWRRPQRLLFGFSVGPSGRLQRAGQRNVAINQQVSSDVQPLLISGTGTLGQAFARSCELRGLPYRLLSRAEMDISDPAAVRKALAEHHPWAVVNAAGYSRVDDAGIEEARCYQENARGAGVLATGCARRRIRLLTFSSDLVFGDPQAVPRVESDRVSPRGVYGHSKVQGERLVLRALPTALVVRPGPIFGSGDHRDDLARSLRMLSLGFSVRVPAGEMVSPSYVPDLVQLSLDLLIDGERGVWHLVNRGAVSRADLVRRAASLAGIPTATLRAVPLRRGERPPSRVLGSERGEIMPTLEDALARYLAERTLLSTEPAPEEEIESLSAPARAGL